MGNVKSNLSATITAIDVNSKQPITRDVGSPSLDSAFGDFTLYDNLATAGADVALGLPETPIYCLYVKNLDAANELTVKLTPQGGAEATAATLRPGAVFIVWNPSSSATVGYTGVKLNPAGANCRVEYYFGA